MFVHADSFRVVNNKFLNDCERVVFICFDIKDVSISVFIVIDKNPNGNEQLNQRAPDEKIGVFVSVIKNYSTFHHLKILVKVQLSVNCHCQNSL